MRRLVTAAIAWIALAATAPVAFAQMGNLKVAIQKPASGLQLQSWETSIEVVGGASIFGGVKHLDLFLVLDSSKSLRRSDPKDYRAAGAIGLVRNLSAKSDIQIGVVEFDRNAELVAPLTGNRAAVIAALGSLDRNGTTDLAEGIETALAGFEQGTRPDSSRVMLLFTDGKSNAKRALRAMEEARRRGVAIHTLLLGSDKKGAEILREIAEGSGGSFLRVTDPAKLPEAFLSLRTTGIGSVALRVNGSSPIPTELTGGTFSARVPLQVGENEIVASATSLDGRTREDSVTVIVSGPLTISIDTPVDGTLYVDRESETAVEGAVTTLGNSSPEILTRNLDRGVRSVVLTVNDSPPFATTLTDGRFRGRVLLGDGENRIVATATSSDGRTAQDEVLVSVRTPGCAELQVEATRAGEPALSISDRAVEIVFDASNSMWGQIDGRAKISIAKEILQDALEWLPGDLSLALRVYGHQHGRELRNCRDSELLVPPGLGNRERIREAIAAFRPRGQTPLGYSLEQISADLGNFAGERAVVLVTDGIESCGGNPAAAAGTLRQASGAPVHVIGFGLGSAGDEDLAGLRAIAEASNGKFLTAGSAEELRDALSVTVGTSYRVSREGVAIADGTLGANDRILLPAGEYVVELDSKPPHAVPVTLTSEERLTLELARDGDAVSHSRRSGSVDYRACEDAPGRTGWRKVPADIE
jgi:Mg-chelatase subunit ChlD